MDDEFFTISTIDRIRKNISATTKELKIKDLTPRLICYHGGTKTVELMFSNKWKELTDIEKHYLLGYFLYNLQKDGNNVESVREC